MYDLIVIGGGPAGLCAAIYAARKQIKTLLLSKDIGGQVSTTLGIENYLGYQFIEGPELIEKFQDQIRQFPIDQEIGRAVLRVERHNDTFDVVCEDGSSFQARTAIYAAGKRPRRLNVPGEAEFAGRGVTYCAICDGPVFAGQKVAVIGGGNSGVSATLDMVKISEHVHLVSITPLTADPVLVNQLTGAPNLTIHTGYQTRRIEGKEFVESIVVQDLKTGEERRLEVGGVLIEIGLVPNSDPVKHLLKLNQWGEVPITPGCATEVPGFFAAGDVTDVPEKQIVVAAGEGAKAALQSHRYLQRLQKQAVAV
ncbi:MAG: FAD-dependent oxidoreductase [Chloroflexi bacterium]|nr:FAD-dependent oxidoreductase [Chloroflexota bacterium]